ncbi:MAG: hypothetical protein QXR87_01580 [Candidatus Hadarchaeales archaeon]
MRPPSQLTITGETIRWKPRKRARISGSQGGGIELRGIFILPMLLAGLLLWRLAPPQPVTFNGIVKGSGYLLIAISLFTIASKLEDLRKRELRARKSKTPQI